VKTAVASVETDPQAAPVEPAAPARGASYNIVAGDSLAKIAKRFYNSSKMSDLKRIVAANPTMLKDVDSVIVAGKTLTIPDAPQPVAAAPAARAALPAAAPTGGSARSVAAARPTAGRVAGAQPAEPASLRKLLQQTTEPVMIYLPGALTGVREPASSKATVEVKKTLPAAGTEKKEAKRDRTYEVQAGDSLEKIARKYGPSNPAAMIAKLKAANGIKGDTLQKGQKLRIP
jgi:LysM repeat protein